MIKMKMHKSALAATLAAFFLAGCGGGSSSFWPVPERQFGVTEAQVMDAPANPDGLVVGAGSGLVVTQIEPLAGPAAPLPGDSAGVGVDQMWFDVDNPVKVAIDLGSDSFDVVSAVAVLNLAGAELLQLDRSHPKGELWLDHGRYLLRFTAAGTATDIALGMVWFGGASKLGNAADLQKVLASPVCERCDLRGANLSQATLRSAILSGADLSDALLLKIPGGLALNGSLFKVLLGGSDVKGADLSSAILTGATLSGAHMTGAGGHAANLSSADLTRVMALNMFLPGADMQSANLTGADFSRSVLTRANLDGAILRNATLVDVDLRGANLNSADLIGTDLTGARLDETTKLSNAHLAGATWTDGRVCADDSVGECK